jgi:hypothetical protein
MGKMRKAFHVWLDSLKGRDQSQDLGEGGRIILKYILGKQGLKCILGK